MNEQTLQKATALQYDIAAYTDVIKWLDLVVDSQSYEETRVLYAATCAIREEGKAGYTKHGIGIPYSAVIEMYRHYRKLLEAAQDEFEKL